MDEGLEAANHRDRAVLLTDQPDGYGLYQPEYAN